MVGPLSTFGQLLDAGRLTEALPPGSSARDEVEEANRRFCRPLQVQVVGRPGVGRDTMARALRERLSVTAIGPGETAEDAADADLWLYLLAGPPRPDDHAALSRRPPDRTIVVSGKSDTCGDWPAATDLAALSASRLGRPVVAVSQLLACADLRDDEFDLLRRLVGAGEEMPSMAADFLTETGIVDDGSERLLRAGLLRRIDQFGIDTAMQAIAAGHASATDPSRLNRLLHGVSAIGGLVAPIRERIGQVRRGRLIELRDGLERVAAAGRDRDAVEHLLQNDELVAPGVLR